MPMWSFFLCAVFFGRLGTSYQKRKRLLIWSEGVFCWRRREFGWKLSNSIKTVISKGPIGRENLRRIRCWSPMRWKTGWAKPHRHYRIQKSRECGQTKQGKACDCRGVEHAATAKIEKRLWHCFGRAGQNAPCEINYHRACFGKTSAKAGTDGTWSKKGCCGWSGCTGNICLGSSQFPPADFIPPALLMLCRP